MRPNPYEQHPLILLLILLLVFVLRHRRHRRLRKYASFKVAAHQVSIQEQIGTYSLGAVLLVQARNLRENLGRTILAVAKQLPNPDTPKGKAEHAYMEAEARVMMANAMPRHSLVSTGGEEGGTTEGGSNCGERC